MYFSTATRRSHPEKRGRTETVLLLVHPHPQDPVPEPPSERVPTSNRIRKIRSSRPHDRFTVFALSAKQKFFPFGAINIVRWVRSRCRNYSEKVDQLFKDIKPLRLVPSLRNRARRSRRWFDDLARWSIQKVRMVRRKNNEREKIHRFVILFIRILRLGCVKRAGGASTIPRKFTGVKRISFR